MTLGEFIDEVCQRPLPTNPMGRIRTIAKELAEGVARELWPTYIFMVRGEFRGKLGFWPDPVQKNLWEYLSKRWNTSLPYFRLLEINGYIQLVKEDEINQEMLIHKTAFDLLDEVEPANTFISYKRSESSAFALLVLARLKAAGLEPFLDLVIEPGDQWHNQLEERIQNSDYFIILLGKETLTSEITCKEIEWAIQYNCVILPIWHPDFEYKSADWQLSSAVDAVLKNNHTIRVLEESALAYNNAIVELLNKFGITP